MTAFPKDFHMSLRNNNEIRFSECLIDESCLGLFLRNVYYTTRAESRVWRLIFEISYDK